MNIFLTYVLPHLYSIPYYVIWLGGILYAIVYRKKHPRASLFAGAALGIMLLNSLVSAVISSYFQYQSFNGQASVTQYAQRLQMMSFISIPFGMLSWLLLLVAVFGWKNLSEPEALNSNQPQDILL